MIRLDAFMERKDCLFENAPVYKRSEQTDRRQDYLRNSSIYTEEFAYAVDVDERSVYVKQNMSEYYSLYILEANNPKKCRARYGLDRQQEWCKPCRYCTTLRISGNGGIMVSACTCLSNL